MRNGYCAKLVDPWIQYRNGAGTMFGNIYCDTILDSEFGWEAWSNPIVFSCVCGVLQCVVEKIIVVVANEMLERRIVLRMRRTFSITRNFVTAADTLVYPRWLTYDSTLNNDFVLASHPIFDFYVWSFDDMVSSFQNELTSSCVYFLLHSESHAVSWMAMYLSCGRSAGIIFDLIHYAPVIFKASYISVIAGKILLVKDFALMD